MTLQSMDAHFKAVLINIFTLTADPMIMWNVTGGHS